jgi:hypothetical protein
MKSLKHWFKRMSGRRLEKACPRVSAGRDFGSGPIGEGAPLDKPRRAFRSAERLRRGAWVGGERQADQRRKRVRAGLLHDGGAMVLDRALAKAADAPAR